MTATLTPTRDRPTRLPSSFDSPAPAARVYDAVKVYGRGENEVRALDGVTVEFAARRFTAIMGPSGSGKSTLIHSVAGLNTQRAQICRSRAAQEIPDRPERAPHNTGRQDHQPVPHEPNGDGRGRRGANAQRERRRPAGTRRLPGFGVR
jgi:ABC-type glutathione transport system ATPase component